MSSSPDLADLHLLQHYDAGAGRRRTVDGTYRVTVGSSYDTRLAASFHLRRPVSG
jgi:hypothetical protein